MQNSRLMGGGENGPRSAGRPPRQDVPGEPDSSFPLIEINDFIGFCLPLGTIRKDAVQSGKRRLIKAFF
jgi:hypothetical protein